MFRFFVTFLLVAAAASGAFLLYQRHVDPAVTSGDLVRGAQQAGQDLVEFGKQLADSARSEFSSPPTRPDPDELPPEPDPWVPQPEGESDHFVENGSVDSGAVVPRLLQARSDTVDAILAKYRAINTLLGEVPR